MASGRWRSPTEHHDLAIGFFGFFAIAFVVISLALQVTGREALWASFPALISGGIVLVAWTLRRRHLARADERD